MTTPDTDKPTLAILGGTPAFDAPLHVGRPNIGDRDDLLRRFEEVIDRRWFTNSGPVIREFEKRLADYLGVKHAIAMCNGTIALEIAMRALGVCGEVIAPSFTFVATAHSIQWQGYKPVFCDIDPNTHCIDPDRVEDLITPHTTAIVGVYVWGRPCAIEKLREIADRRKLKLLFDAAHAFGCSHQGKMIGGFGDAEVFSFHATKFFNTFEGGAVATNDDDLAEKMRLMKNFGFSGKDNVIYIGTNGKMNEVSAAMGLTGLDSIDTFIAHNRENYEAYGAGFANIPGIRMMEYNGAEKNNYQYVIVEVDEEKTGLSRNELVKVLEAERVLARRYFYPGAHQMEPYRSFQPHAHLLLPETEKTCQKVMSLPTGIAMTRADIDKVCQIVRLAIENSATVRSVLEKQSVGK